MKKVKKTVSIEAPVSDVFRYVSNPESAVEWLPSMQQVNDIDVRDGGVGTNYRWTYTMAGMRFEGESVCTDCELNRRLSTKSRGGIISTWDWFFEEAGGGTKMTIIIEYTVPVPVLGRIAETLVLRQNRKEADQAVENIKRKMEKNHTPAV